MRDKISVYFSTFFLVAFVTAGVLSKEEGLEKLERLRERRSWKNNIIYLVTKEELERIKS